MLVPQVIYSIVSQHNQSWVDVKVSVISMIEIVIIKLFPTFSRQKFEGSNRGCIVYVGSYIVENYTIRQEIPCVINQYIGLPKTSKVAAHTVKTAATCRLLIALGGYK